MNVWARLLVAVEEAIASSVTDLSASPLPFTVNNIPETLTGRVFSVDIQSNNTGKARERLYIRAAHNVTIEMLHSYAMCGGRQEANVEAKGQELEIIDALMSQSTFKPYRMTWRDSRRVNNATLTHFVTTMRFDAEHDFSIVAGDEEPVN